MSLPPYGKLEGERGSALVTLEANHAKNRLQWPQKVRDNRMTRVNCPAALTALSIIVAIASLGAVFWSQAAVMNWMSGRVDVLEQKVADLLMLNAAKDHELTRRRTRRSDDLPEASEVDTLHERTFHHGIPSRNIAHYYGDPKQLESFKGNDDKLVFAERDITSASFAHCHRVKQNGHKQYWCVPRSYNGVFKEATRFCTSASLSTYPYFQSAPYMDENSESNFKMEANGWVRIMSNGTYLIYANIQFMDSTQPNPNYVLEMERGTEITTDISSCISAVVSEDTSRGYNIYSCTTQIPVPLHTGDRIAMKIKPYVMFRVMPENFYFGLIKLNDNTV